MLGPTNFFPTMQSLLLNDQEVELLKALTDGNVRYLIIGGHAVIFHGHLRPAKDLDIWVEPTQENANKTAIALASVRIHLQPMHLQRLASPGFQMPIGRLNTEILTSVTGLAFNEAFGRSTQTFEQDTFCRVLSLQDLITTKKALARELDLEDVANLEARRGA